MPTEKTDAVRQRRAEDTRRWRKRRDNGRACYSIEIDGSTFDLMERLDLLRADKVDDRVAVSNALKKLLGRAVDALLRELIDHVTRHASQRKPR